jgi:homoserine dehydrogenase
VPPRSQSRPAKGSRQGAHSPLQKEDRIAPDAHSASGKKTHASASRKLRVALAGFGTVGRSVAKLLSQNPASPFVLTHICNRNIERKKVDWLPANLRWTENADEVLSSDVDIFVELIGGLEPAGEWVSKALRSGKSVVTANKLLIAERGPQLLRLAREAGRQLEFGASVAGGIPAIIAIQEGLAGDRLHKIAGILNGTCNYILTKMESTGASFDSALREAQQLGYAEADPTSDVEGFDARAKLVILAQAGLRVNVRTEQVPCSTISSIEAVDFAYARELGCTIRQISMAQKETKHGLRLLAAVRPTLVPLASLIAHVQKNQNLVMATGEFAGQIMLSGYGAGGDPTAVAVISDLYAIARRGNAAAVPTGELAEDPSEVSGDFTVPHYVRFVVRDRPGIVAEVATVLAKYGISIDALLQKPGYPHSALPFIMTLEACSSALLDRALQEIAQLDFHVEAPLCLPILTP